MTEDSLKFSEPSLDSLAMGREVPPGREPGTRAAVRPAGAAAWELGSAGAVTKCRCCDCGYLGRQIVKASSCAVCTAVDGSPRGGDGCARSWQRATSVSLGG